MYQDQQEPHQVQQSRDQRRLLPMVPDESGAEGGGGGDGMSVHQRRCFLRGVVAVADEDVVVAAAVVAGRKVQQ